MRVPTEAPPGRMNTARAITTAPSGRYLFESFPPRAKASPCCPNGTTWKASSSDRSAPAR